MRRLCVIVLLALLAGCTSVTSGSGTGNGTGTGSATGTGATSGSPTATGGAARVGGSIRLRGDTPSQVELVTLVAVRNQIQVKDNLGPLDPEQHAVAVELTIKNAGLIANVDNTRVAATVTDSGGTRGQSDSSAIFAGIDAGPILDMDLDLEPGQTVTGWLPFDIANGKTIATVTYRPGHSGEVGHWQAS